MTTPTPPPTTSSPRPLGSGYLLVERVGAGAQGEVWRAHATQDPGRPLAVKLLRAELLEDPGVVERFVRERSTLMRVRSPHVVGVRDMVVEGASFAIVMDYVGGGDLREHLRAHGPLTPELAVRVVADVAEGLAAVHAAGIVHRDLKPANVLLDETAAPTEPLVGWGDASAGSGYGRGPDAEATTNLAAAGTGRILVPRLADFGVARICDTVASSHVTAAIGTPLYMAPEILGPHNPTPAADIYSLGVVLYELLTGLPPFLGAAPQLLAQHARRDPGRITTVPEPLWGVVQAMMAKHPQARPSAEEVSASLRAIAPSLIGLPAAPRAAAPPPSTPSAVPYEWDAQDATAPTALVDGPGPGAVARTVQVSTGAQPTALMAPADEGRAPAADAAAPDGGRAGARRRRRGLVLGGVAALLVIALAVGGWVWWSRAGRLPVLALANLPATATVSEMQRIPDSGDAVISPDGQSLISRDGTDWALYDLTRSSQAPVWSGECMKARFWTSTQLLCEDSDSESSVLVARSGSTSSVPGPPQHNLQATTGELAIVIDGSSSGSLLALNAEGEEVWRSYGDYTDAWASPHFISAYDTEADEMRVLSPENGTALLSLDLASEPDDDEPLPGGVGIDVGPETFYTVADGTWTVYDKTGAEQGSVDSAAQRTAWAASTHLQPAELVELLSAAPTGAGAVAVRGADRTVTVTVDVVACTATISDGATLTAPERTDGEGCVMTPLALAGGDSVLVVAAGEPTSASDGVGPQVVAYTVADGEVAWQVKGRFLGALAPWEQDGEEKGAPRMATLQGASYSEDLVVSAVVEE